MHLLSYKANTNTDFQEGRAYHLDVIAWQHRINAVLHRKVKTRRIPAIWGILWVASTFQFALCLYHCPLPVQTVRYEILEQKSSFSHAIQGCYKKGICWASGENHAARASLTPDNVAKRWKLKYMSISEADLSRPASPFREKVDFTLTQTLFEEKPVDSSKMWILMTMKHHE